MSLWTFTPQILRLVDPETAHRLTLLGLRLGLHPRFTQERVEASGPDTDHAGVIRLFGKTLPNRLGLAAGFDKNAEAVPALAALGFGAVEVGSVTPLPQPGNPRPRVFRLPADRAVVNRYGFNSGGHDLVRRNLDALRPEQRPALLGVNLGANKTSENIPQDFALGVRRFADIADYLVINVSSPNTPGLRDHQTIDALARILDLALDARVKGPPTPLLLKIAPDLADADVASIVDLSIDRGIEGLIATNTTIQRPTGLRGPAQAETGGLSGQPLFERATQVLANIREQADDRLVIFGTGGVGSPAQAEEKRRHGADLVQLYTGLIYGGPGLVQPLAEALSATPPRRPRRKQGENLGPGTRFTTGLGRLLDLHGYRGLIVDLWGVMHNGEALFPEALDALMQARIRGVQVQFLSNAPRRAASVQIMLDRLGLPRAAYDGIVSSGEESWQGLKARSLPFYRDLGPVCFHLGAGEKDANMREGLDFSFQDAIISPEGRRADWILNTGPEASTDLNEWIPLLREAGDAGLPMVCANPDRVVMRGTTKELCAGSLAEWYEADGGAVQWHGKPFPDVYRAARGAMRLQRQQVLAIGDSFTTDVAGARAAGIDVLLVNTGIHQADLDPNLQRGVERLAQEKGLWPNFADHRLQF
ncbi:MAG: quinone-dependent dihydroorotate dehydrogenase [Rhodospirillaceae bacterium]|nr:MAG: quinone-dependent dihydroorotate dehydrogenase [Rhodospirillaceae bacterium]